MASLDLRSIGLRRSLPNTLGGMLKNVQPLRQKPQQHFLIAAPIHRPMISRFLIAEPEPPPRVRQKVWVDLMDGIHNLDQCVLQASHAHVEVANLISSADALKLGRELIHFKSPVGCDDATVGQRAPSPKASLAPAGAALPRVPRRSTR